MANSASPKSPAKKNKNEGGTRTAESRNQRPRPQGELAGLHASVGNQALGRLFESGMQRAQPARALGEEVESKRTGSEPEREGVSAATLLRRASADHPTALDGALASRLEAQTGADLSDVRIHSGPASAAAAESIGARAYTLGSDIYLGSEVSRATPSDRGRLLAHEAVHTIQQGGRAVPLRGQISVSRPGDASEVEASRIARGIDASSSLHGSPALALRGQLRAGGNAPLSVSRTAAPVIQRDIKNDFPVREGNFRLDLTTESHPGGTSGMSGTIKFKAKDTAPDSDSIRLLQVVRDEDLTTGKDYVWTGGEANRNKMRTAEDKASGVEGGFFVDHSAAAANPRTKKTDPAVSPYYRDYWPNAGSSQDGSKKGKSVQDASLWDSPGSGGNRRFSFETVAKDAIGGHVYGTVMWGFTISDAAKGTVDHERAVGRNVTLRTTDVAIDKFNQFYKNPGSSTAP